MMNTDLRQIRHVVTLGRVLNFTRAARELGITQSALTRSIQSLEDKARVRLFDRDRGGRVRLTDAGKVYLGRASILLRDAEDLDRLLQQSGRAEAGEVHFGMVPLVARALMPDIVAKELVNRPQLRSTIWIRSVDNLLELLQSEAIEFCVCAERAVPPAQVRATLISSMPLSLLVRAGHPLLDAAGRILGKFPVMVSGQMPEHEQLSKIAHPNLAWPPQIVIDDFGILAQSTVKSDAVWLASSYAAATELRQGTLRELPLPNEQKLGSFRVVMYSSERRTLSPAAKRLAQLMRTQMSRFK